MSRKLETAAAAALRELRGRVDAAAAALREAQETRKRRFDENQAAYRAGRIERAELLRLADADDRAVERAVRDLDRAGAVYSGARFVVAELGILVPVDL